MKPKLTEHKFDIGISYMKNYVKYGNYKEACKYTGYGKDYCLNIISAFKKEFMKEHADLYGEYKQRAKENQSIGRIEEWQNVKSSESLKSFSKRGFLKELKTKGVKEIKKNKILDILAYNYNCGYSSKNIRLYLEANGIKIIM